MQKRLITPNSDTLYFICLSIHAVRSLNQPLARITRPITLAKYLRKALKQNYIAKVTICSLRVLRPEQYGCTTSYIGRAFNAHS